MLLGIAIERLTRLLRLADLPLPPGLTWRPDPSDTAATERCTWRGRVHARRGARRECLRARRRRWPCRTVRHHRRGPRRRAAPAAGRRSVGARTPHAAIGDAMPGLGGASRGLVRRQRLLRERPSATPASPAPACGSISSAAWPGTLLTNRVHPTRHRDTGIDTLRRRVGDLIVGQLRRERAPMASLRRSPLCCCSRAAASGFAASVDDLVRAYPDFLAGFDGTDLIWRDGTRMPVGDGRPDKTLEEQFATAPSSTSCACRIPSGAPLLPAPQQDPGRVRNKAFFDKMYGDCTIGPGRAERWCRSSGCRTRGDTSSESPRSTASIGSWTRSRANSMRCPRRTRDTSTHWAGPTCADTVADTGQTSMHGWGAAIDINTAFSDYWLWHRSAGGVPAYINRIPPDVVDVFERHGFIWGGRWAALRHDALRISARVVGQPPLTGSKVLCWTLATCGRKWLSIVRPAAHEAKQGILTTDARRCTQIKPG